MITKFHKKTGLVLAIFLSLIVAVEAVKYLGPKDSVDLCNKIIGSRLLDEGISPYTYFWKTGDPPSLYNPYETIKGKVNSLTTPPSLLIAMKPLSFLSFSIAKWVWLYFSYLMMAGCIFVFSRLVAKEDRILVWSFSIFFFLTSAGWLLHVERGQVYVVYLFLLCGAYYFYKKENLFLSLGCLAILIWFRFPFVVFILPYLSHLKNYKAWAKGFFFVILLTGITLAGSTLGDWQDYSQAVQEWSVAQITQTEIFADADSEKWRSLLVGKEEGRDYLINNSSLQYLAQYHFRIQLLPSVLLGCLILGVLTLVYSLRMYFYTEEKDFLFLLAFLVYIGAELCIPAPRYNYTYIQWLFPFLVLFTIKNKIQVRIEAYFFFLLGLLLNMGLFFFIPRALTIGEGIIFLTFWWVLWYGQEKRITRSVHP